MDCNGPNCDAVRRLFELGMEYIKGGEPEDVEATLRELCATDILLVPSSALASGDPGPFRGPEGVMRQYDGIARHWKDFDVTVDDYVEVPPSTVVLLGRLAARRDDGSGYAMELGMVNRFEEGRLASVHSYQSKRRALEEAGAPT
ncbi:MAG TPA: nuclear transport factor 2 family protein [Thermoleophilaceae bacterium]